MCNHDLSFGYALDLGESLIENYSDRVVFRGYVLAPWLLSNMTKLGKGGFIDTIEVFKANQFAAGELALLCSYASALNCNNYSINPKYFKLWWNIP